MADLIPRTVRLSPKQDRQLQRLSEKLNMDNANVIRYALTRLAEKEGIK